MTNELPEAPAPANDTRSAAREKAQQARLEQKKRERRNRYLLRGGIVAIILGVGAVIVVGLITSMPRPVNGPLNMLSDGIRIGTQFEVERTASLKPDAQPVASVPTDDPDVVDIRLYIDYFCPACAVFEQTNAQQIETWVQSGAATVEVHPMSMLDRVSMGSQYSTRAANAAACVANHAPDSFFDFNRILFANQPEANTAGHDNAALTGFARQAGVQGDGIANCIEEVRFKKWVRDATIRAFEGPLPHADVDKITRTPTIIVNGVTYTGARDDATEFAKFVSTASGTAFNEELKAAAEEEAKASESPSPSPSPAETPAE